MPSKRGYTSDVVIPDGITPIIGYRTWTIGQGRSGWPRRWIGSINDDEPWGTGVNYGRCRIMLRSPRGRGWHDPYKVPDEDCSCGFYAVRSLDELRRQHYAISRMTYTRMGTIMGTVELTGKIIPGERGFRAQKAKVHSFMLIPGVEDDVVYWAGQYGVEVSEEYLDSR